VAISIGISTRLSTARSCPGVTIRSCPRPASPWRCAVPGTGVESTPWPPRSVKRCARHQGAGASDPRTPRSSDTLSRNRRSRLERPATSSSVRPARSRRSKPTAARTPGPGTLRKAAPDRHRPGGHARRGHPRPGGRRAISIGSGPPFMSSASSDCSCRARCSAAAEPHQRERCDSEHGDRGEKRLETPTSHGGIPSLTREGEATS
jgi:hypothetical protein